MTDDTLTSGTPPMARLQREDEKSSSGSDQGKGATAPRRAAVARRNRPRQRLNLAFQGGGAYGAFTWGVLDALLEQGCADIEGVSGTSAGAVNAVVLASGLMEGGPDHACALLGDVWSAISHSGAPSSHPASPLSYAPGAKLSGAFVRNGLERVSGGWSPYDLNPLNINPLRDILLAKIDFDKLRRESPVQLFIAATEVVSGRGRIFRTDEVSADAVAASACLPNMFPAVRIGRFYYWDGAFSANPDLVTLISETHTDDTLLVQISPDRDPGLPSTNDEISANIGRLTFNQPLRTQIEHIEMCRRIPRMPFLADDGIRRMGRNRFHLIDGSPHILKLARGSKFRPDWKMIEGLRDNGRADAEDWLRGHLRNIGKRATADLYAKYFSDRQPFD